MRTGTASSRWGMGGVNAHKSFDGGLLFAGRTPPGQAIDPGHVPFDC